MVMPSWNNVAFDRSENFIIINEAQILKKCLLKSLLAIIVLIKLAALPIKSFCICYIILNK